MSSRWKHIYAKSAQSTEQYRGVNLGSLYLDANPLQVSANAAFFAYPHFKPRGSLAVVCRTPVGPIADDTPVLVQEGNPINGFAFSPFHDSLIATAHQDGSAAVWRLEEGGLKESTEEPASSFDGHSKRLLITQFHPLADNVLLTACAGKEVRLWDVEAESEKAVLAGHHKGLIQSIDWNCDGSLYTTFAKDKTLRVFDPRSGDPVVAETKETHQGAKGGRAVWLGNLNRIVSIGFSKSNARELCIYDPKDMSKPLLKKTLDNSSSSTLFPIYDEERSLLILWGKGDGLMRCFEMEEDSYLEAAIFKSSTPCSGVAMLPQALNDVNSSELFTLLKLSTKFVDQVVWRAPQANAGYDPELWPDTWDGTPLYSAEEWFAGAKDGEKKMVSQEPSE